jgi:hypothetical protein
MRWEVIPDPHVKITEPTNRSVDSLLYVREDESSTGRWRRLLDAVSTAPAGSLTMSP